MRCQILSGLLNMLWGYWRVMRELGIMRRNLRSVFRFWQDAMRSKLTKIVFRNWGISVWGNWGMWDRCSILKKWWRSISIPCYPILTQVQLQPSSTSYLLLVLNQLQNFRRLVLQCWKRGWRRIVWVLIWWRMWRGWDQLSSMLGRGRFWRIGNIWRKFIPGKLLKILFLCLRSL